MAQARIITDEQQNEILACLAEEGNEFALILLYLLLRDTGLRISEAITLKFGLFWEDHKIKRVLFIPAEMRKNPKKAMPVTVVLSKLFRDVLQLAANRRNELGTFSADAFLFPGRSDNQIGHIHRSTANRRLKWLFVQALGAEAAVGMSSHSLRRTLATDLYRLGVRPEIIQRILGHRQLETSLRYIEISNNQLTEKQRELHRQRQESFRRSPVRGCWRNRGNKIVQLGFLDDDFGYKDLPDISCTNDEAARALLQTLKARLRSTRCKPQPPRPRRRSRGRIGSSSE